MKYLYKYPQAEYPYQQLVEENQKRGYEDPEFELLDTGIFEGVGEASPGEGRYFDIFIEYAKASDEDISIKVTAHNKGDEEKPLHILPTLWFRNTWSWEEGAEKPSLKVYAKKENYSIVESSHSSLGVGEASSMENRYLYCQGDHKLLFVDNETNKRRLSGQENSSNTYPKDGINRLNRKLVELLK